MARNRLTKPQVPLTPANVNLLNRPEILLNWLRRLNHVFADLSIDWYIQGSLAGYVHGIVNRSVTDIDIRAHCKIEDLFDALPSDLACGAIMRGPVVYSKGEFQDSCIMLEMSDADTHVDITTEIRTYRQDLSMTFEIPFDSRASVRPIFPEASDEFPVCSIEYLIIYKLVHQRDRSERKNDLGEVCMLLASLERTGKHNK
ncbi:MAG TPA: hypothetical protein VFR24_23475 [Candidatus Angelobacter sp.]|nr:hypothetical protein [Candidatus Angelobacter sp.]